MLKPSFMKIGTIVLEIFEHLAQGVYLVSACNPNFAHKLIRPTKLGAAYKTWLSTVSLLSRFTDT